MNNGFTDISWVGLAWSACLIAIVAAVSFYQRLDLEKRLLIGCIRTVVQLIAIGYILGWIISASGSSPLLVIAAVTFQLVMACWSANSLLLPRLPGGSRIAILAIAPSYMVVISLLLFVIIQPQPLWDARIVLPLGGMLLGNTITGFALALNRYRSDLRANRELVLARLALGTTWPQAVSEERSAAAQAAVLPTIASLYTVGIVALPGMMTGQIIAGADPLIAVRYQIIVMFMIAAVVSLGTAIALTLMVKRGRFEPDQLRRQSAAA